MGCFLRHALNSEFKIRVPGVSRMMVAVSGQHWWMAGVESCERDVLSFFKESRDRGWRPEQWDSEVRIHVHHESLVQQVVCPQRHHFLKASQL